MATKTLLEMTQSILSSMNSDQVNSINDTVESQQVAGIIRDTYFDLLTVISLPEHKGLIELDGLGDLDRPNFLKIPDNVVSVDWVKYRDSANSNRMVDVCYLSPDDFLRKVLHNLSSHDNVQLVTDASDFTYYIKNNKAPRFYTIFDDEYLVFDSYDSSVDSTLQSSKSLAYGTSEPVFTMSDAFIPDLDAQHFPLLLAEAKTTAFMDIKQVPNPNEERKARKMRLHLQYRKWRDRQQMRDEFEGVNYARPR